MTVRAKVRRFILRATIIRLRQEHPALAAELEWQMQVGPIPNADRHEGGAEADFFVLNLSTQQVESIVEILGGIEAELVDAGAPPFQVTATADLLDSWNRLLISE